MKNLVITIALAATLSGSVAIPCALAQTPAAAPAAAASAADHAKIEAALKQLDLTPRQKIQMVKIMRAAKENNQDKKVTLQQLSQVLTPAQHTKLKTILAQSKAAAPPAAPKPPQ